MSSTILNQYGNPIADTTKMIRASDMRSQGLQWTPQLDRDFDELFNATDWRSTLTQSRIVFSNFPVPRAAAIQKATYAVGQAWLPEFRGENAKWGERHLVPFLNNWCKMHDMRGECYDLTTNLFLDSLAVDRDGDVFAHHVIDDNGYPKIQRIDAHSIGQRYTDNKVISEGPYAGYRICKGVVLDKYNKAIAYKVLGSTPEDDRIYPSSVLYPCFNPEWHQQGRGIPAFASVIPELRKSKTSETWELMAQLVTSAHAIVEYNDTGTTGDFTGMNNTTIDDGLAVSSYSGGMVRHFKANSGNKIEMVSSNRPSASWDEFQDRVQRMATSTVDWSYEMAWKPDQLNGVSVRMVQQKCRRAVAKRQADLKKFAMRQAQWAVAVGIQNGYLQAPTRPSDWNKFDFSMPPQLSIDDGRDQKADEADFKYGRKTLSQLLAKDGRTLREHINESVNEYVLADKIIKEAEASNKIEIDRRYIMMLTPNEQPMPAEEPQNQNDED